MGSVSQRLASQHCGGKLLLGCREVRFLAGAEVCVPWGEHQPHSPHVKGWGRTTSLRPTAGRLQSESRSPVEIQPSNWTKHFCYLQQLPRTPGLN